MSDLQNPKFDYDVLVRVSAGAEPALKPRETASVVGVFKERPAPYFDKFPPGVVYTIEFEDGLSGEIHESLLEAS
jgi:hypothetical protein